MNIHNTHDGFAPTCIVKDANDKGGAYRIDPSGQYTCLTCQLAKCGCSVTKSAVLVTAIASDVTCDVI